ncbi:Ribonuclease Phyb [Diplonema papillatum]|nr:Ribonuclease Phyb [Diplonema papillatum]
MASLRTLLVLAALTFSVATAQEWLGNYYKLQFLHDTQKWTLHGLWPQWSADGYCRNVTFNESAIADLLPRMEVDWPSGEEPNQEFWAHEWQKHGSCTNMTEHPYFATALNLYDSYNHLCPDFGPSDCAVCFDQSLKTRCNCTESGRGDCPPL